MGYVITDGVNYVVRLDKGGTITGDTITTNKDCATKWERKTSADNVLRTIKASTKSVTYGHNVQKYNVVKIEGDDKMEYKQITMIDSIEESADVEYLECDDTPIMPPLHELIDILDNLPKRLLNENNRLTNQLREVSMAITDVYHYLELTEKISASDRCKLSMLESELLRQRRKIKDDMYILCKIQSMIKGGNFTKPNITEDEDRKYQPRVLNELFDKHDIPKSEPSLFEKIFKSFR